MNKPGEDPLQHRPRSDFLGVFALVERDQRILMVQNQRYIEGRSLLTWDLPGGGVEAAELLTEALARELHEETGLRLVGSPEFLFLQDGERVFRGRRSYAWRSFFFRTHGEGEPKAGGEVLDVRWFTREEALPVLTAPYHASFAHWLQRGGHYFPANWREGG